MDILELFGNDLEKLQETLYKDLKLFIGKLARDRNGKLIHDENQKLIGKSVSMIEQLLIKNGYYKAVDEFIESFEAHTGEKFDEFRWDTTLLKKDMAILNNEKYLAENSLKTALEPVKIEIAKVIRKSVLFGSTQFDVEQEIKSIIQGSKDVESKYIKHIHTLAYDSMTFLNRSVDLIAAEKAEKQKIQLVYKWDGFITTDPRTKKTTSRLHCQERNGYYYSLDQLIEEQKNDDWAGKKPGADLNPLTVVGGYLCYHHLRPYPINNVSGKLINVIRTKKGLKRIGKTKEELIKEYKKK